MSRLFTFGCSFTKYKWDTWADIIGKKFSDFINYGQPGAGNLYILHKLTECHMKHNICKDDTVIIMWSTTYREDRFVNGDWYTPGNVYNSNYPNNWVNEWCDPEGFLIRDLGFISSAKAYLENTGCNFHMLQIMDVKKSWTEYECSTKPIFQKLFGSKSFAQKYIDLYQPVLDCLHPSVYNILFNNDWNSRNKDLNYDLVPIEEFLKDYWDMWKGDDWPTLSEWANLKKSIYDEEIENYLKDFEILDSKYIKRYDTHPTTDMHFEYIQKVLPNYL